MSYNFENWDTEKFKWYVRDAELMLKQLRLWLENDKKREELEAKDNLADAKVSAEYIVKHSKAVYKGLTGREY